ncbi:hypothetical protein DI09_222p10 [Mitosporidium daphniae]|uniref:DNA polymerase alpha subunit B n=1 Tax=Mitosporidium daphniae TaxID=1485682 RepID=A0A098VWA1_9MICR|nr:uncharacterized protein DI09_222p10 [Mitosporidium daphniae]KGG52021.1 hypothetical protein DI09_222p10 [Mitosporidium daphniae]|eukprot:XP_013238457.1 uncharacterized protein DI09_222p10 [Mitosporidium daphniae]
MNSGVSIQFPLFDETHSCRIFEQQYSQIYFVRLNQLRQSILESFLSSTTSTSPTHTQCRLLDLKLDVPSFVVGTIYIDLPKKPNVLSELSTQLNINSSFPQYFGNDIPAYGDDNAFARNIFAEDESGRIQITFSENVKLRSFVTSGMVLGLTGRQAKIEKKPLFVVDSIYFASSFDNLTPVFALPNIKKKISSNDIVIACSLFSSFESENFLSLQKMFSFLQMEEMNTPNRVIIAGNICALDSQADADTACFISDLDNFIYEYLVDTNKSVILIPGSNDPTSISLPQRPIVRGLFEKSSSLLKSQFELTTNPSYLTLDGKKVLVVSGQNIDDMARYYAKRASHSENLDEGQLRLILAQITLVSRHIAPTAPDTLC